LVHKEAILLQRQGKSTNYGAIRGKPRARANDEQTKTSYKNQPMPVGRLGFFQVTQRSCLEQMILWKHHWALKRLKILLQVLGAFIIWYYLVLGLCATQNCGLDKKLWMFLANDTMIQGVYKQYDHMANIAYGPYVKERILWLPIFNIKVFRVFQKICKKIWKLIQLLKCGSRPLLY
jgi:hypothetical protein